MSQLYMSYLRGAPRITDGDLTGVGAKIVERSESGSRSLTMSLEAVAGYEKLITEKLDNGFWNEIVSDEEIIFIFKPALGTARRLVLSADTKKEIGVLCSELTGDPIEKTSNVLAYLGGNSFYDEMLRRYVYKHLPQKSAAAGGLFLNGEGNVLIVKPTYKPEWSVPGGIIDAGETARQAFARETYEEIGLMVSDDAPVRCIQYTSDTGYKGDRIHFVFDGGVLSDEQIGMIKLDPGELSEFRFVPLVEALTLLGERLATQIDAAYKAREQGTITYLEQSI